MMSPQRIAGIVLAGGQSSRMGENKAFLVYKEKFLIDHMITILENSGCHSVYVSGKISGYPCLEDPEPDRGPAVAVLNILQNLAGYDGFLFVPVDMPELSPKTLSFLMQQSAQGAFYTGNPLPFFLPSSLLCPSDLSFDPSSIYDLLKRLHVSEIPLPAEREKEMLNINTKREWNSFLNKTKE